jgi:uncharacterized circularly permuted ATP-grasp superfamily protein
MIAEAIQRYHALLADGLAMDTHIALCDSLMQRGLFFGDTPLCRVLRPHFYDVDAWNYLKTQTGIILRAFAKAHQACMQETRLRQQLDLESFEEQLFSLDQGVAVPWSSSRLDAFFQADTRYLRFVEYNAETPAGIGYGDELTEAFLELEVMKRFQNEYIVHPLHGMPSLLDVLLRGYKDWGGTDTPQIAIVDWAHVPTRTEHEICRAYFESHGYRSVLADPRDLEYRDGNLWAGDFRVDIVYKRVLVSELIREMGVDNAIVQAVRDHKAYLTNSFSAKLMAKKASFAFLSDEQNSFLFDDEERNAIALHIPWTRRVADRKTRYLDKEVDLLAFIRDNQERLVLKPNDEYGGKGVVIGWETSADEWEATLQTALTNPYVVQERVNLVQRDFPMMIEETLDISPRFIDADPYVFYGQEVGGCLTRLSSGTLLNVTAGSGSVVPMFVIEKRMS